MRRGFFNGESSASVDAVSESVVDVGRALGGRVFGPSDSDVVDDEALLVDDDEALLVLLLAPLLDDESGSAAATP